METSTLTTIRTLKKDLLKVIEMNNYNLLSPEVIKLSNELDRLMLPLFKRQLDNNFPF
ncbi:MAG: aspartyl-phosphate phosphatase Spo0E family protein [Cellulosilyticum sp.]|nr:aspartyl-phosphate phosphatase Spo0E family protein [Cellulosilyticum sp.]